MTKGCAAGDLGGEQLLLYGGEPQHPYVALGWPLVLAVSSAWSTHVFS